MTKDTRHYEVGYGKPPRAGRFKKGLSGNPSGRPMHQPQTFGSTLREMLTRDIEVVEDGRRKHVTMIEVIITQLVTRATKGDLVAARMILKLKNHIAKHGDITPLVIVWPESDRTI